MFVGRRLLVGMHDYYTGLEMDSFEVVADFLIGGMAAEENRAERFKALSGNRRELAPDPANCLVAGMLTISVKDRQGALSRIERTLSVVAAAKQ